MRHIIALLTAAVWLAGLPACSTGPKRDPHSFARTKSEGGVEGRPTLGLPISIPGQPTLLVPFAVESEKGWFESRDPYARGRYGTYDALARTSTSLAVAAPGYAHQSDVRWHNALFRDVTSGEQWPLLTRRGIVSRWQILGLQSKREEPFQTRALLFIAVLDDSNRDGLLDDLDARVAILTDPDGRRPRVITPPDAQVWGASYDVEKNLIFLQVVRDTTGDGRFAYDDLAAPCMTPADAQAPAMPVISDESRAAAERLLGTAPAVR
jgi:hypothetical protein